MSDTTSQPSPSIAGDVWQNIIKEIYEYTLDTDPVARVVWQQVSQDLQEIRNHGVPWKKVFATRKNELLQGFYDTAVHAKEVALQQPDCKESVFIYNMVLLLIYRTKRLIMGFVQ